MFVAAHTSAGKTVVAGKVHEHFSWCILPVYRQNMPLLWLRITPQSKWSDDNCSHPSTDEPVLEPFTRVRSKPCPIRSIVILKNVSTTSGFWRATSKSTMKPRAWLWRQKFSGISSVTVLLIRYFLVFKDPCFIIVRIRWSPWNGWSWMRFIIWTMQKFVSATRENWNQSLRCREASSGKKCWLCYLITSVWSCSVQQCRTRENSPNGLGKIFIGVLWLEFLSSIDLGAWNVAMSMWFPR